MMNESKVIERSRNPGYKQTEVGLIPEDWQMISLNKLIDEKPKYGVGAAAVDFNYDSFTYLRITDIDDSGNLIKEGLKSVTHPESANYILKKGELVFARTGASVGKCYLYNESDGELVYAGFLIKVKPKEDSLNAKYFREYVNSKNYWNWIIVNSMRSGQPGINGIQLGDLKIPLPPTLAEQKVIATALSDVDDLMRRLDALIAKKKAIKQGAMQQLLTPPSKGGKRLDGFDGDWERKEVQKFINVGRGGSPRPIQDYITNSPDGVNWIKIGDTSKLSKYITSSKEKIIREGEVLSRAVKVGDFLLSNSMSFGRPYILKIDGCIHDGWLVLQDYQDYFDIDFLYYTLMSKDVFDQYLQKASGSGVLNLNKELVKVVELNRPTDLKEQQAIAQILSDMDKELEELATKKEKYEHIKQGMMQELLTGKTRLV